MSLTTAVLAIFVVGFFLGSIPFGLIISRVFFHKDLRDEGSGNIGTTNAFRALGPKAGSLVFLLDFGKGLLSGLFAWWIASMTSDYLILDGKLLISSQDLYAWAFFACVYGHIFSPWLKGHGGKGIATAIGCLFVTFGPQGAALELAIFAILALATKTVSVGSLAAAFICPILAYFIMPDNPIAFALCALVGWTVIWAHRSNVARFVSGEEAVCKRSFRRKETK